MNLPVAVEITSEREREEMLLWLRSNGFNCKNGAYPFEGKLRIRVGPYRLFGCGESENTMGSSAYSPKDYDGHMPVVSFTEFKRAQRAWVIYRRRLPVAVKVETQEQYERLREYLTTQGFRTATVGSFFPGIFIRVGPWPGLSIDPDNDAGSTKSKDANYEGSRLPVVSFAQFVNEVAW